MNVTCCHLPAAGVFFSVLDASQNILCLLEANTRELADRACCRPFLFQPLVVLILWATQVSCHLALLYVRDILNTVPFSLHRSIYSVAVTVISSSPLQTATLESWTSRILCLACLGARPSKMKRRIIREGRGHSWRTGSR